MDPQCRDVQVALRDIPLWAQPSGHGSSGSTQNYPKDPCTAFLCETVSPTIAVDVTQPFFCHVHAVLNSLSQVSIFWQGHCCKYGVRLGEWVMPELTCHSLSHLWKVCNEWVEGLKTQEGQSFCIFFPQNEFLFTLTSRCEQCRSWTSSIKIELKCS